MINFDLLENCSSRKLKNEFLHATPFPHLVIDAFCEPQKLLAALGSFPNPDEHNLNKSRDYIFAKNKFEKSEFKNISPELMELYKDLTSERFKRILQDITNEDVFVDPNFHGGGLHQGGKGSFLDMHADFNFHPKNNKWFRNLNILLYLNTDWLPEQGGQLRLKHKDTSETEEIEPIFNRCVIMLTRDYTLHGYNSINFPEGKFRRSVAAYAYTLTDAQQMKERSTTWYPEKSNFLKSSIGRHWPTLVKVKNKFFGSSTGKNK